MHKSLDLEKGHNFHSNHYALFLYSNKNMLYIQFWIKFINLLQSNQYAQTKQKDQCALLFKFA